MAALFYILNFQMHFHSNEHFCVLIKIPLKFVPEGSVDNKSALVQFMAWHHINNESFSEPMMTLNTEGYLHQPVSVC